MVWAPPRLAVGGRGQWAGCFLQSHEDLLLSPGPLRQIWAWETQCQPCRCVLVPEKRSLAGEKA